MLHAYLNMLQDSFYEEAERRRYTAASEIKIDWGELKFILDEGKNCLRVIELIQEIYISSADSQAKDDIAELLGPYAHLIELNNCATEQNEKCYRCAKTTKVVREEQYTVVSRNDIRVKCLDCLFEHLKDIQQEAEKLARYLYFVQDKELEEQLEAYLEQRKRLDC